MLEGPGADSEEKHEPVSDIDTAPMEGLKALDPKRPIREADMCSVEMSPKAAKSSSVRLPLCPQTE